MLQTVFHGIPLVRTDCKASTIGWGSYMSYLAIYCLLYTGVVESAPIELMESFIWVLREWGIWLVLTPLVFGALRALHTPTSIRSRSGTAWFYGFAGISVLSVALLYRVGIDAYGVADPAGSAVYFFAKHATALVLVVLAWHLARKPKSVNANNPVSPPRVAVPETLWVSKGQHESLIRVDQIDVISAAGNYVDIRCGDLVYLLRSSLKQLEDSLPAQKFVRVHRSHLVNVSSLLHMTKTAAGNGSVILRSGHVVPMSKKYRAALKPGPHTGEISAC